MERAAQAEFAPCDHKKREADPHSVCETCLRSRKIGFCTQDDRCDECFHLTEDEFALFIAPLTKVTKGSIFKEDAPVAKSPKRAPKPATDSVVLPGKPCPDFPLDSNVDNIFEQLDQESDDEAFEEHRDLSGCTQKDPLPVDDSEPESSQKFVQRPQLKSVVKSDLAVSY